MQFFQIKFKWVLATDDGKLKNVSEKHLIQAKTCTLVLKITRQLYESSSPQFEIVLIKTSDIKDVFLQKKSSE